MGYMEATGLVKTETVVTEIRVTIMEGMWLQEVCQCRCMGCGVQGDRGSNTVPGC